MTNKQKQKQLQYLNYYKGKVDGIWGAKSNLATSQFQKDFGLESDGCFGIITENKTIEIIKIIQRAIGLSGFKVDGKAGNTTTSATKVYQKKKGLTADGIAGEKTRKTIPDLNRDFWETVKYFKKEEFKCKCGGKYCNGFPVEVSETLVKVAERMRKHFNKPIIISSSIRCAKHNANVGGVSNSRHKLGKAMDFTIKGVPTSKIIAWVKKQPEYRYTYAIDSAYVHMDVK